MWSMSKSALEAAVIILASVIAITSCVSSAPAAHSAPGAPAQADQQHVAQLDQLIADVEKNLEATRTSAAEADAFKQQRQQQLADFRAKLAASAPSITSGAPGAKAGSEAAPDDAVHRALAAFEARAAHADALLQLRNAQVAAREARLAKLKVERELAARGEPREQRLADAEQRMAEAEQRVAGLARAEREADARSDEALNRYKRARQGDSNSPQDVSETQPASSSS